MFLQFRLSRLSSHWVLRLPPIRIAVPALTLSLAIVASMGMQLPAHAQDYATRFVMNYQPAQANAQKCIPSLDAKAPSSYLSEFYDEMSKSCDSETLSEEDRLEYLVVTMGVLVPNPATPYLAVYGGGKFTGHMKDCLTDALINASGFDAGYKQTLRKAIADVGTLKGWKEALQGLPELADSDQIDSMLEIAEEVRELHKKKGANSEDPNGPTIYETLTRAYSNADHAQKLLRNGPVLSWLYDMDHAMDACRYDDAERLLEKARVYTRQICERNGAVLRVREREYLAHIGRMRARIERSLDGPARRDAALLFSKIEASKRSIDYHLSNLEKIDGRSKELDRKRKPFKQHQQDYLKRQNEILTSLRQGGSCETISRLDDILANYPATCRSVFFRKDASALLEPDALYDRLVQNGRSKIRKWWNEADKVERAYRSCDIDEAESIKSALQSQMRTQPVYQYDGAQCSRLELMDLKSHLAGQTFPNHCHKVRVPRVVGQPVSKASDLIYEANLVPGEVITLPNEDGRWREGMVIKTKPAEGSDVRPQSIISIFKAGKKPSEQPPETMVNMPDVIGKQLKIAQDLVRAAGLVVSANPGLPANEEEQIEGQVYASSHAANRPVAAGSAITLTHYKAATYGTIPSVAGKTVDAARSLLLAAGFKVTGPGLGKPAPEGEAAGDVYDSRPGANSREPLGSPVEILLYGPSENERAIPDVSGKAIDVAAGMIIGDDGFFVLGNIIEVSPMPEGGRENHVIRTEPAAGEFAAKGTLVVVYVYPDYDDENSDGTAEEAEEAAADADSSPSPGPAVLDNSPPETGNKEDPAFFYGYWKSKIKNPQAGWPDHSIIVIERKVAKGKYYRGFEADFLEYWVPDKKGRHRRFLTLPVIVKADGIVADTKVIEWARQRKAAEKKTKKQGDVLGLSKVLKNLAKTVDMLKSLSITYDNGQCIVAGQDSKGKQSKITMHCEKLPGPVFLPGRED